MSTPVFTSGYLDGSGKSAHGAKADHTHDAANQAASTAADVAGLKNDFNALLVKLKNAGLMTGDAFSLTLTGDVNDSFAGHADRQYNTGKISGVELADGEIVITLSEKVSALRDFDGGGAWGTHKWLGIGINAGIGTDITKLKYNGSFLTAADNTEAVTECGLDAGYFVRWVAADLVLAGDNTKASKGYFTLWADGYAETLYRLKIVEPA